MIVGDGELTQLPEVVCDLHRLDLGALLPSPPPRQAQQRHGAAGDQEDQLHARKPKIIPRPGRPDPASILDTAGLAALAGLEMVAGQLTLLITVLRAGQARRKAGIEIRRAAWKNLVFTRRRRTFASGARTGVAVPLA